MKEAIFTGRSSEEALLKASQELGVNISDMTYEVLDEETSLFGLFRKDVRVVVRVREDAAQVVTRANYVPGYGDTGLVTTAGEILTLKKPSREKNVEALPGELPASGVVDSVEAGEFTAQPVRELRSQPETILSEKGPAASKVLGEILGLMGMECQVEFEENPESVSLNVSGGDYEMIVGRDGEVLAALQFIVNKIVNRFPDDRKLVILDAEGFRGRREQTLGKLARRLGDKAVATGRVIRLSPMTAQDRRLMHLALRENRKVSTRSEGVGDFRRLLIIPAGFEAAQKDNVRKSDRPAQTPPRDRERGRNA
ncbi:MAG TPA: RNA-binding cell elongation regulator Jag/EloR [Myxococcota bacterium]|nr:RNA-binding cell elongation regulator Jag/EloR [Myxococcota bacterium]HOA12548.1 RNA-binding cell elongation regulator Jag/EloR [Myxococcota bacterium]HOC99795.1 RNA-binding cell elongation regulator Jag/EloR [Myxococcota bacterium]HOH76485.1 RNA-binding cell elongation regulator Jag/EloR [Myxococcota bacterium]HPV03558.1 RNA-binding cell elongation regulator Jag/EloR [Myxococcota bacterium]